MAIEKISLPEGDVVAITVYPSRYPPIRYAGQVWIRVCPRKSVATEEDVRMPQ
jgi:ATP-dependent DNA helicase RecG